MAEIQKNNLRVVIFAGGVGTRMWPLSRKATPKQFEKMVNDQSTLQLSVERISPEVPYENIYISTGKQYRETIREQLPQIPAENIIGEPEMRDVAPAVGYLMSILAKDDPWGPVAILWSDHLLKNVDSFKQALQAGAAYVNEHKEGFVFLGQKPRFANQNLGWIQYGEKIASQGEFDVREFVSWHYRPDLETADKYFKSEDHSWNPGYFIVAPQFVLEQFKQYAENTYDGLMKLQTSFRTPEHETILAEIYPTFEKISFDDAILMKIPKEKAVVLPVDLGWSDIGTWDAFKEALQESAESNLTKGKVVAYKSTNSLVFNYTDKLVTAINCKDLIVVATKDVIMVVPQESIPEIKKMLGEFAGSELEQYT